VRSTTGKLRDGASQRFQHGARRETYFRRLFPPLPPCPSLRFSRSALRAFGPRPRESGVRIVNRTIVASARLTGRGFARLRVPPLRQFDRVRSPELPRNGAHNYRPRFTCKSRDTVNSRRLSLSLPRSLLVVFYLFHRFTMCSPKHYGMRMEKNRVLRDRRRQTDRQT
jgi:hypothetical protein